MNKIDSYDLKEIKSHYNSFYKKSDFIKFPYAEKCFIKSLIKRYNISQGSNVLDLCCGTGKYSSFWKEFGMKQLGVDISEVAIKKARNKYPECNFKVENVLELETAKKFDVIFASGLSFFNTEKLSTLYPFLERMEKT